MCIVIQQNFQGTYTYITPFNPQKLLCEEGTTFPKLCENIDCEKLAYRAKMLESQDVNPSFLTIGLCTIQYSTLPDNNGTFK